MARSAEQIGSEIVERFGFLAPHSVPALANPAVLENLWQQTLRSYGDNILPSLWLERLFVVLAFRSDVSYCVAWHSRVLRTMGMDAADVRNLLDGPDGLPDPDAAIAVLAAAPADLPGWAEPGPVGDALLRAAVSVHLRDGDRWRLGPELRRVVPAADHDRLVLLLGYVATCLQWLEAHPQLSFEADLGAGASQGPALSQVPDLDDFSAGLPVPAADPAISEIVSSDRAEDADRRFFLAFDHAPIGIALTRIDGGFLRANQALCQLVGYDQTTLTTMSCYDLTDPADAAPYREKVERLVAGNTPSFQMDKRYRHPDGTHMWIRQSVALLRTGDGSPLYLISHTQDITALRTHAEQLAAANTELERSNRDLLQFSAVAAHDLKGPLTAIVGYADLLTQDLAADLAAQDRDLIDRIAVAGTRMGVLVDDLLSLAQVGTDRLRVQWTDLDAMLADLLADLREHRDIAGARISVAVLGGIWAHPTHLRQVFANLITNAVKYTAAGQRPEVVISAAEHDDGIVYTIADNGVGVPADAIDSIFTMYHRENTDTAEGTGVGLAICQRVIERHGGAIWMEHRPGGGSLFHFRLPRLPVGHSAPITDMPAHPGARGRIVGPIAADAVEH
jgi:PAS domain S-box-containing protein